MKAAQYIDKGLPLKVHEVPEPRLRADAVVLGKLHTFVSPSWQGIMAAGPAGR